MSETTSGGTPKGTGLAPNIASLLCYFPGISLIFMALERDSKDVQFHAWQGTVLWVGYILTFIAVKIVAGLLGAIINFLGVVVGLLIPVINLAIFVLLIVCLVKAYQGERWMIPYIGEFAAKKAGL